MGVVGNLSDYLEAKLLIKTRCLKAVGAENQLPATSSHRLRLGFSQHTPAETLPANGLGHPHLPKLAGFSPGVPCGAGHDVPGIVSQEDAEKAAIIDPRRGGIELVQPVFEELDVD
jgi:hypothetical protein